MYMERRFTYTTFEGTVKHFLFARTLFSREFTRPVTHENKVHANISHVSIIVQEMNNRENKVTQKISVLQYLQII